jgi:hypothetical protein
LASPSVTPVGSYAKRIPAPRTHATTFLPSGVKEYPSGVVNDFVVDDNAVEVKTIHDKLTTIQLNLSENYLQKSLPDSFNLDDLKNEICSQIKRKKWTDHLENAINRQKGKLLFFNVTHS